MRGVLLPDELAEPGHHYARVPLRTASTGASTAWPHRVEARRGIRRVLRAAGTVDVVHLRMADLGSMVAAEVAAELGIPVGTLRSRVFYGLKALRLAMEEMGVEP